MWTLSGSISCDFRPLARGGQNRKICDCARTRRPIVPPFWATIIVSIRVGDAPLPRSRVDFRRLGECGRRSAPPSLPHMVRSLFPLDILLTRFLGRLELVKPPTAFPESLDMALRRFSSLGPDPLLDRPHCLTLVHMGMYSIVIHGTHNPCAFLRVSGQYSFLHTRISLNLSPPLPPSLLTFIAHTDLFLGGL